MSKLVLYLQSKSKDDKKIFIEKEGTKKEYVVEKDMIASIKSLLEELHLKLSDFDNFVAMPTESFTGYRETVNVCNLFKHFVKNTPVNKLQFPKYHKEPNITARHK